METVVWFPALLISPLISKTGKGCPLIYYSILERYYNFARLGEWILSGTRWYSLTGNMDTGHLTNGNPRASPVVKCMDFLAYCVFINDHDDDNWQQWISVTFGRGEAQQTSRYNHKSSSSCKAVLSLLCWCLQKMIHQQSCMTCTASRERAKVDK